MRVFLVVLLAALALGGVLRFSSRASAPAAVPLAAAAPPQSEGAGPARSRIAPPDELPTASIPPEQPRLLKVRPHQRKAIPIPQPPPRAGMSREQKRIKVKVKSSAHTHNRAALPTWSAGR
jgi:hypothetical protein